jgi:hypothetical protein
MVKFVVPGRSKRLRPELRDKALGDVPKLRQSTANRLAEEGQKVDPRVCACDREAELSDGGRVI